jgi:glutathione-independent formaldehyde dehydrogenase
MDKDLLAAGREQPGPFPGGPDELARRGEVAFDFGLYWFKGQRMRTGQCPVKAYNRYLRS